MLLLHRNLPLLTTHRVVLEPRIDLALVLRTSLRKVVLYLVLHPLPEEQILSQQVLIHRNLLQNLLHLRLVEKIHLHILGSQAVNLIDLLLQIGQLRLTLQHQHYLQAIFLRRSQEDQTTQVTNVLSIVGKVRIQLEVEVDIQVQSTHNGKTMSVPLLVEHQQTRTVLLPLFLVDMNEHLSASHENQMTVVLAEPRLQLLLQKRVDLHLNT